MLRGTVRAVVGPRSVAIEHTEEQVLAQLRDGNEEAFCALVRRHSPSMTRVAMAFVSRRAVADEVVQETWLNVVRGLDTFEAKSSLRTWIWAILRNCARRRAEQEQRLVPLSELAADEALGDDLGVSRDRFFEGGRGSACGRPQCRAGTIFPRSACCRASYVPRCSKRSMRCRECREQ
jgi:hypothetical protein